MTRLLISVEGKSERKFVEQTLVLHLSNFDIFVQIHDMKGAISVDRVSQKLNSFIHHYDFVTMLYDFYGFKGLGANETKKTLEKKIKESIKSSQQNKIIPYIQMYEFEALLFSDAKIMANNLNVAQNWIDKIINTCQDLERINNSKETAPSKRIGKNATYIKTQHAPKILQEIGLPKIRKKCQGFNEWITQLEKLGE